MMEELCKAIEERIRFAIDPVATLTLIGDTESERRVPNIRVASGSVFPVIDGDYDVFSLFETIYGSYIDVDTMYGFDDEMVIYGRNGDSFFDQAAGSRANWEELKTAWLAHHPCKDAYQAFKAAIGLLSHHPRPVEGTIQRFVTGWFYVTTEGAEVDLGVENMIDLVAVERLGFGTNFTGSGERTRTRIVFPVGSVGGRGTMQFHSRCFLLTAGFPDYSGGAERLQAEVDGNGFNVFFPATGSSGERSAYEKLFSISILRNFIIIALNQIRI
jgi:hypothetical protein